MSADTNKKLAAPPFFSIIVPVYNAGKFLAATVHSLLQQTCPDFELIIVDDASTDTTPKLVADFCRRDGRVICVRQQANQGVSKARNRGISMAQGQYLVFCDADDFVDSDTLGILKASVDKYPADLIVTGFCDDYYDDKGKLLVRGHKSIGTGKFFSVDDIPAALLALTEANIYQFIWNKIYKRVWLQELGAQFYTTPLGEDALFNLQLYQELHSLTVLPQTSYHYCHRPQASLTTKYADDFLSVHLHIINQEWDFFKANGLLKDAMVVMAEQYLRFAYIGLQMSFYAEVEVDTFAKNYQLLLFYDKHKELLETVCFKLPASKGLLALVLLSNCQPVIKFCSWLIYIVKHRYLKLWYRLK
jgi:glycosyltransferase involved in cell wall biosynthesis